MSRQMGSWSLHSLVSIGLAAVTIGCASGGSVKPVPERSEAVNRALKASLELPVASANSVALRLMRQEYDLIESEYRLYFENYQNDVLAESPLQKGYDLFFPGNSVVPKYVDAWVETTGSDIAYTARAYYLLSQASSARGGDVISQVPREKLLEMQRNCDAAAEDFGKAVENNPGLAPAWVGLLRIAMMADMPFTVDEVFKEASRHNQRSFYLRQQYMLALEPRWGGSYEAMATFARQCANEVHLNPRFWSILGTGYADRAGMFALNGDHKLAIEFYSKALEYGDKLDWLQYRSNSLMISGEYDRAMADAEKILQYSPQHQKASSLITRIRQLQAQQG